MKRESKRHDWIVRIKNNELPLFSKVRMPVIMMSFLAVLIYSNRISAQEIVPPSQTPADIKGYVGIAHTIYTFSKDGNSVNFKNYYSVALPCGINFWKTKRIGISLEFAPVVKSDSKSSKVSYILFHPGILYRVGKGFTIMGRAAFESTGRYGFTPILSKILIRQKGCNIFASAIFPARFGNDAAPSFGMGILLGLGF